MMRMGLILNMAAFLIISCQNEGSTQKEIAGKSRLSETFAQIDTLNQIKEIDENSRTDTTIDVLQYFTKTELPNIYRLGGIAYQPYFMNGNLAKIILDFEGDRETLRETYYFNEQGEIFYVTRIYSIYEPPKWEEGSKEISSTESKYFISDKNVRKSVGDSIVEHVDITKTINKVMQLKKKF